MKCNPLRWLWGLLPILALAWLATWSERPRIEADLDQRARQALVKAGYGWARPAFQGRDGTLAGTALDEGEPAKAFDIVRNVWGVRAIEDKTALLEKADKFVWTATRLEDRIRLNGFVPGGKTRSQLLGILKAEFPDLKVEDKLAERRGAPSEWLGAASFALQQLKHLKSGHVDLDGTNLSVVGEALTPRGYRTVRNAVTGGLPRGIALREAKLKAPLARPFAWSAKLSGKEVVLSGVVPSDVVREDLISAIKTARPGITVVDQTEYAEGAPPSWPNVAITALRELGKLENGSVDVRDTAVTFEGLAQKEATADAVRQLLRGRIPSPFKLTDQIRFVEPSIRTVSPFVTGVSIDGGTATITGHAPSPQARARLIELLRAKAPSARLIDTNLQIGAGAPPGWQRCIDAGVDALARIGGGTMRLSDRALQVRGSTTTEALAQGLPGQVRGAVGGDCDTDVQISFTPPPEPKLTWHAHFDRARAVATLEGEVPDEIIRTALLQQAQRSFAGAAVSDRMVVKGGYGRNWGETATEALKLLGGLRLGDARIVDQTLTITGEAPDGQTQAAVQAQLGRLPRGYVGTERLIVRTDAAISAEAEAKRRAELEAEAKRRADLEAEAKRRADLEAEARRRAADAEAKRRAELEAEAKRRADAEAEARRKAAAETEARRKAEIDAEAKRRADAEAEAKRKADAEARRLAGIEAQRKAALAEAERCQASLRGIAKAGVIRFKFASADIDAQSLPTLDQLAKAANACASVRIDIEGHTDTDGAPDRNQRLSERRARSVLEYLVKIGVPPERLQAVGYGETRPVAPNDTVQNKSLNRRIEFMVRTN